MEIYEIIKNVIRFGPLLSLAFVYLYLLKYRWYNRIGLMFFIGWFFVGASTYLFWWYSFSYAPNEEVRSYVAQKDGAPRLLGTIFGWAYGLVLLLIFELVRLSYLGIILIKTRISGKNA